MRIALRIATNIILRGMSVVGASVQTTNLETMSLLKSNTPSGITIEIESSAIPTPRQPMPNSHRAMSTENVKCLDIFTAA
jgi:hypothetical protein